ncbi:MAG: hypothetical protein MJ097_08355, partial [Dorea sp.]|nr:hypothetical protein [Dorea sp.]
MKNRPLFFICLILSGILMFITFCGEDDQNPLRKDLNLEEYIEENSSVTVSGTISKIIPKTKSNAIYLKDVHVTHENFIIKVTDFLVYSSLDNNFKTWKENAAKEEKAEVQDSGEN